MSEAKKTKPRKVVTTQYQAGDGTLWPTEAKARKRDRENERREYKRRHYDDVIRTPSGLFSVRCQGCGKRTARKYSDDFVHCKACQERCGEEGHEPDDDSPEWCFHCGKSDLKTKDPTPPPGR